MGLIAVNVFKNGGLRRFPPVFSTFMPSCAQPVGAKNDSGMKTIGLGRRIGGDFGIRIRASDTSGEVDYLPGDAWRLQNEIERIEDFFHVCRALQ